MRSLLFLFCLLTSTFAAKPPPALHWQKMEDCTLIDNEWNDGDSFHVRAPDGKEFIFRLYFVDTPEAEGSLPERVAEQAADFKITPEESIALGKKASAFTRNLLTGGPFTVYTRWNKALGRSKLPRYYAMIEIDGEYLQNKLVKAKLARIYGVRTPLPDGKDSREYLTLLHSLENVSTP